MKFSCFSGGPNFYKSNNQRIFAPRDNSSAQIERYSPEPKIGSSALAFMLFFCALMRYLHFVLYNIEVFESRGQRCKEWAILCKESRFLTTDFLAGADLVLHPSLFAPIQNMQITKNKTGI
jgi:hypothetical protein